MSFFMVKSSFEESSGSSVDGFNLVVDRSREEIQQELEKFVNEYSGEEFYYSDCNCVDDVDMDGFEIVELSKEEYDVVNKLFGNSYGLPIPDELFVEEE